MNYFRIISGFFLLFSVGLSYALTIVHMETQLDVATSDLYFELYDDVAPNNVSNFTGYITRGDYDNSFFHRKAQYSDGSPFVVQGGGFTYIPKFDPDARAEAVFGATDLTDISDPITGELGLRPIGETYFVDANNDDIKDEDPPGSGNIIIRTNDGLKRVPVDTFVQPVLSESSRSNLRGTIAMALTSTNGVTNVNSASNQWFINLNNNTQLDPNINNAGFTVFGRVLGNGIDFFDAVNNMNTLPIATNVNPEFGELPVINYDPFTLVLGNNLAKLNSASEVFNIDVTDYDFGFADVGMTAQKVITLTVSPQWPSDLVISKVGDIELLDSPLSATTDCDVIQTGNSCVITVTFAPTTADNFQDVLDIAFSSINIPNLPINFTARSRTFSKVGSSTANSLDFQFAFPGIPETETVLITNLGQQPLEFTAIAIDDVSNFTQTENCIGVALAFNESCEIDVTFNTPVEGLKTANLIVTTNAPESPFVISLLGTGSVTDVPDIDAEKTYDFGDLFNGTETSAQITIINRGVSDLNMILPFTLTGDDESDFTGSSDCIAVLAPDESCILTVKFTPSSTGVKEAIIKIVSNDPDEPEFSISLIGTSSSDSDNIPDAEENAAPNGGDGDSDSVPDRFQSNVVSMLATNSDYLTLTAANLLSFQNTAIVENPSPTDVPNGVNFNHGIVNFNFSPVPGTVQSKIGMILPAGQNLDSFYQYGPTPDNPVPHWFEFMFDQNTGTGAQIFNNVTLTAPNGKAVQRNIVQIWYVDGQRGDADLTVNGNITSTGGVIGQDASSASSSLSGYLVLMLIILLLTLRDCHHYYSRNRYR